MTLHYNIILVIQTKKCLVALFCFVFCIFFLFLYFCIFATIVPYGEETTVQFTQEEYEVAENNGTVTLYVTRTFPTGSATCTWAGKTV